MNDEYRILTPKINLTIIFFLVINFWIYICFTLYYYTYCTLQFRSSDRLVTDQDIRIKELERLYIEKQKLILEKQERILQSYKWVQRLYYVTCLVQWYN